MVSVLTNKIALRRATEWNAFSTDAVIPVVYGNVTLNAVKYDRDGKLYVIADHPVKGISKVVVEGKTVSDYQWYVRPDSTGKTVTFVELNQPASSNDASSSATSNVVSATVQGKTDASGSVITNPADIVLDILTTFGIPVRAGRLAEFRALCSRDNIVLGGVLNDASKSILTIISELMTQIGAVWSLGVPDVAMFYPPVTRSSPRMTFSASRIAGFSATSSASDLVTKLNIEYRYDWAKGKPLETASLESSTLDIYDEISATHQAQWVRTSEAAIKIAERLLLYKCAPHWTASMETDGMDTIDIGPTDWVVIDHPHSPGTTDIPYFVIDAQADLNKYSTRLDVDIPIDINQSVKLVALNKFVAGAELELRYLYQDGRVIFSVFDVSGKALPYATITIRGTTWTADAGGQVAMALPPGTYSAAVSAKGYTDQNLEVTVNQAVRGVL